MPAGCKTQGVAHSDVLAQEDALYVAIAGQHQIWRHEMASGTTAVFSGDGYERNANGRNGPGTSWAQPSGISLSADGSELWVADSESSCVRSMSLATGGSQVKAMRCTLAAPCVLISAPCCSLTHVGSASA